MSSYTKIFLIGHAGKTLFFSDKEESLFAFFNVVANKRT